MCRHTFKYLRIFKLWGEVVFYSLCMTGVAAAFFPELAIGWRDWLMAVMPISFDRYWFVSRYVALFFMIPFLNHLLHTLDRKSQDRLVLSGFLLLSAFPCISGVDMFVLHYGYCPLWFIYLYLVAGWISLNEIWKKFSWRSCFLLFVVSDMMSICFCSAYGRLGRFVDQIDTVWGQYSSPFVLIEACSLLVFFANLNVSRMWLQRLIAYVAPSIFSVYVLHSNSVWRRMIGWNGKYAWLAEHGIVGVIFGVLGFAVLIFIGCILIDMVRRETLHVLRRALNESHLPL